MDSTAITYISFETIFGFTTVIGNGVVLWAIYDNSRLRTTTNCFIGSLALADFLVGIFVAPIAALSYLSLPRNFVACLFTNSLLVVFTQISIFNLLAVGLERFLAIKYPFVYHEWMTIRNALIIISVTWVLGIIVGLVPVMGWNLGPPPDMNCAFTQVIDMNYMVYFNFLGFVFVPLLLMLAIYIYIFHIVRKQINQIAALSVSDSSEDQNRKRQFFREIKAAKALAIVIGLFAFCWLPIHILNSITLLCGERCSYAPELLLAGIVLSHANSSFNPFLYAYGNSQFRVAFRKFFCCCCLKKFTHSDEINSMTQANDRRVTVNSSKTTNRQNGGTNLLMANGTQTNTTGHI